MNDEKMRKEQFSRTERLLGRENMERLSSARVAVFGIGGVGGHAMEALARSGIGALDLVDSDRVCVSNLNRQIIATRSTLGMYKVDASKERILDINPEAKVTVYRTFFLPENADSFPFEKFDYIVDAIDTVAAVTPARSAKSSRLRTFRIAAITQHPFLFSSIIMIHLHQNVNSNLQFFNKIILKYLQIKNGVTAGKNAAE